MSHDRAFLHRNVDSNPAKVGEREDLSVQIPVESYTNINRHNSESSHLQFDRLQTLEKDLIPDERYEFGQFIAREASLDEENWVDY